MGFVAGALAGTLAAVVLTAMEAGGKEAGFPQATRLTAPRKKVDSCNRWEGRNHPQAILFSIF
jgi:hypothetical protein